MNLELQLDSIEDKNTRENLQRILDWARFPTPQRGDWKFLEITFGKAVANFKFPHGLGFNPKDVIQTRLTGAGSLTFNYTLFDKVNLDITTTGACVVRAFVGSYS